MCVWSLKSVCLTSHLGYSYFVELISMSLAIGASITRFDHVKFF